MKVASDAFNYSSYLVTINRRQYVVECRQLGASSENVQHQYRILVAGRVIKDWTDGNLGAYFPSEI